MVATKKQEQKSKRQLVKAALDAALAGTWEEAIAINDTIIGRFPREAEAMNRKGRALIELRQLAAAREAYSDALKADPANMIARRNLQRLETLHNRPEGDADGTTAQASIPRANVFIEEIGKTWVDELANPADLGQLAEVAPGSLLAVEQQDNHLVVSTPAGVRLGEIDDMTAQRILSLIAGGNRYEVFALGVSGRSLRVILREVFKEPAQGSRLSFPNKSSSRTSQLMRERELLFQREEGDFLFSDEDEEAGGMDEAEQLTPDDDEEVEIDREADSYVGEAMNDDDEENNAM